MIYLTHPVIIIAFLSRHHDCEQKGTWPEADESLDRYNDTKNSFSTLHPLIMDLPSAHQRRPEFQDLGCENV